MADEIVYTAPDGRTLSRSELQNTSSEASPGSANIPDTAQSLFEEGVSLAQSGNYADASNRFQAASRVAPQWPYPYYQQAFSLALQRKTQESLAFYRKVNDLEPGGFFSSKTAIFVLEREVVGTYPEGLYVFFVSHEWKASDEEKIDIMKRIIDVAPDFAPAYQKLAYLTEDGPEKLALLEKGLERASDAETRGMLLLNKAAYLNRHRDPESAVSLLGELILDASTAKNVRGLAKVTLRSFLE